MLVLGNLGFEAWREAVDRRRAMLGDVAVAAIFSELSAAELARVERTTRASRTAMGCPAASGS